MTIDQKTKDKMLSLSMSGRMHVDPCDDDEVFKYIATIYDENCVNTLHLIQCDDVIGGLRSNGVIE